VKHILAGLELCGRCTPIVNILELRAMLEVK